MASDLQIVERLAARVARDQDKLDHLREELIAAILRTRRGGATMDEIARAAGITRQRVQQILRRAGLR